MERRKINWCVQRLNSLSERIKDQGENTAWRWDSVKTPVERPWQRQSQSGTLYEEAKRFLAGTSNFMSFGDSRIEQRHGEVGLGMKPYGEAMVQSNTRRREGNRKLRWEPGYDEYCEHQDPGMYEMRGSAESAADVWRGKLDAIPRRRSM